MNTVTDSEKNNTNSEKDLFENQRCVTSSLPQSVQLNLLQAALSVCTDRISIVDREMRILLASPAVAAAWQVPMQDLLGSSLVELLGQSPLKTDFEQAFDRAINGEIVTDTIYLDNENDTSGHGQTQLDYVLTPWVVADGLIKGVINLVIDQSEREHQRNELNYTRQRLADFVNASSDWHWEMDSELRFTWISSRLGEIYGIDPKSFLGKKRSKVASSATDQRALDKHLETLEARQPFRNFDYRLKIADDSANWARINGVPIFDKNGDFAGYRGTGTDISETKQIEAIAELEKNRFLRALDYFPGGLVLVDKNGRIVTYNLQFKLLHEGAAHLLESHPTYREFLEALIELGFITEAKGREKEWINQRLNQPSGQSASMEIERSGSIFTVTVHDLPDGSQLRTLTDITEQKNREAALKEQEMRFRDIAETAADWFWETNEYGVMTYLSERFAELTGISPQKMLGENFQDILSPYIEDQNEHEEFAQALVQGCSFSDICIVLSNKHHGSLLKRYFLISGKPVITNDGQLTGFRGAGQDISNARKLEEQLLHQASHDALTNLPNRREFGRLLRSVCGTTGITKGVHAVAYIDLDQFKIVNDTVGHRAGDQLLEQVSQLMANFVQHDECLARLGGDEFGFLFKRDSLSEIEQVAQQIIAALNEYRFTWETQIFAINASIGLVPFEPGKTTAAEIMTQADLACYSAKDNGRGRVHTHSHTNTELAKRKNELIMASSITNAMEENRFCLYCQPIVNLKAGNFTLSHLEILLRMKSHSGELLSPGTFIPAAERFDLMEALDRWVLRTTLKNMSTVLGSHRDIKVSINLSGKSLANVALLSYVEEQLEKNHVHPGSVCFELTETAAISNLNQADTFIQAMKSLGCEFALDDFGSGLSSFAYIKHFPVDYLKIDGSFVRDMIEDPTDKVMVSAINQMGHLLKMQTIAEFVESDDLIGELIEIGVDYAQGYGIATPEPFTPGVIESVLENFTARKAA